MCFNVYIFRNKTTKYSEMNVMRSYMGPCPRGMARPRFVGGEDDLQIRRTAANNR